MDRVSSWLTSIGLPQYYETFEDDGWDDMDVVLEMGEDDIEKCGITKRGHVRKIKLAIDRLQEENAKNVDIAGDRDSSKIDDTEDAYVAEPTEPFDSDTALVRLAAGTHPHEHAVSLDVEPTDDATYDELQESNLVGDNHNVTEAGESEGENTIYGLGKRQDDMEERSKEVFIEGRNLDIIDKNDQCVQSDGHTVPLCCMNDQCVPETDERMESLYSRNDSCVLETDGPIVPLGGSNEQYIQTDGPIVPLGGTNDQCVLETYGPIVPICDSNDQCIQTDGPIVPICDSNDQCIQTDGPIVPICGTNEQCIQTDGPIVPICGTNNQCIQTDRHIVTNDQCIQTDGHIVPVIGTNDQRIQTDVNIPLGGTNSQCFVETDGHIPLSNTHSDQCVPETDGQTVPCFSSNNQFVEMFTSTGSLCIPNQAPGDNTRCGSELKWPGDEKVNMSDIHEQDSDLSDADDNAQHALVKLSSDHAMVPHEQPLVAQTLTLACPSKTTMVAGSKNVTIADTVEIHNEHESPPCFENYSAQTQTFLHTYKRETRHLFVKTRCYKAAADIVEAEHWVVLLGNPGDGKSTIAYQLMLEHRREDYQPILVTSVDDWKTLIEGRGKASNKQFVVIDDIFGLRSVDDQKVNEWLPLLKLIQNVIKARNGALKVVCTSRQHIFADIYEKVSHFKQFGRLFLINMNATENALTLEEKTELLNVYCNIKEISVYHTDVKRILEVDLPFGFPRCVDMYCTNSFIRQEGESYFYHMLEPELVYLSKNEKTKYCSLVLIVLSPNNTVIVHKAMKKNNKAVEDALRIAGLPATTPVRDILDALESLRDVCVVETEQTQYSFKHSAFRKVVSVLMTRSDPKFSLRYFALDFLVETTKCEGYKNQENELVAVLPKQYFKTLMYRLTKEIIDGDCNAVCRHQAWENTEFLQTWMKHATQKPEMGISLLEALTFEKSLQIPVGMSLIPGFINAGQVKAVVAVLDELNSHFSPSRNKQFIKSILDFTLTLLHIVLMTSDNKDGSKHIMCLSVEYYLPLLQTMQCVTQTFLCCSTRQERVSEVDATNGNECRMRHLLGLLKTTIQRLNVYRVNEQDGNLEVNPESKVWHYCNEVLTEFMSDANITEYDETIKQILYENYKPTQFRRMPEHRNVV